MTSCRQPNGRSSFPGLARELLQRYRPVENHIQGRPLPQFHLFAARKHYSRKSDRRANTSPDPRAFPAPVGESSNAGTTARQDRDAFGILALPGRLFDGVLATHHLLAVIA